MAIFATVVSGYAAEFGPDPPLAQPLLTVRDTDTLLFTERTRCRDADVDK